MAKLIPNEFQQYEFSEEELKLGSVLSPTTLQLIQTRLALAMLGKVSLKYDIDKPTTDFVQQEAYIAGEIAAYRNLIDAHNAVVEASKNVADLPEVDPLF